MLTNGILLNQGENERMGVAVSTQTGQKWVVHSPP